MVFAATRSSMYKKETFMDNVFFADLSQANAFFNAPKDKQLSFEEMYRLYMRYRYANCDVYNCKDGNVEFDFDEWERQNKERLAKYKDLLKSLDDATKAKNQKKKKDDTCPPQITADDLEEELDPDEEDLLNRLEDLRAQEEELQKSLMEQEAERAAAQKAFENEMNSLFQMKNEMERNNQSQQKADIYKEAVNVQVKPWQQKIDNVDKKVEALKKDSSKLKDIISKKLEEIKKKIDEMNKPKKKKKKGFLGL